MRVLGADERTPVFCLGQHVAAQEAARAGKLVARDLQRFVEVAAQGKRVREGARWRHARVSHRSVQLQLLHGGTGGRGGGGGAKQVLGRHFKA